MAGSVHAQLECLLSVIGLDITVSFCVEPPGTSKVAVKSRQATLSFRLSICELGTLSGGGFFPPISGFFLERISFRILKSSNLQIGAREGFTIDVALTIM